MPSAIIHGTATFASKTRKEPPLFYRGTEVLLMAEIRRSPVEVGSLSHYLQCFIRPRWCRISSINSRASFHQIIPGQVFLLVGLTSSKKIKNQSHKDLVLLLSENSRNKELENSVTLPETNSIFAPGGWKHIFHILPNGGFSW